MGRAKERIHMAIIHSIIGSNQEPQTVVVNKYKEPYDVYIGRGSLWGNPYTVQEHGRELCIAMYEQYIRARLHQEPDLYLQLLELKGKRLGCFCKPKPCHGDVLVRLIQEYSN